MRTACRQCDEIVAEYRDALLNFWRDATEETRATCRAAANLMLCSEDDATNAQQQLRPFTFDELTRLPNELQARI
jgi:hypothetical protein